jgi:putative salt-induced outer membrane protein
LGGSALYATSNHIETAQRWAGHFQTDLNFSDRAFWFAALRYEDDRFSGFAYQESFSTGAGRDFIKSDKTHLMAQLGVGVRKLRSEELFKDTAGAVIQRIPGEPTTDAVANAALVFERQFGASTKLIESLTVESGQANTSTKNNLSLQVRMNETLALAVGFQINNNSSPPPGMVTRTDKLTTINLVYELKNPKFSPTAVSHGPPTVPTLTTAQAASSGSSTGGK